MDLVYFKSKSEKDYRHVPLDGPFISVIELKAKIVQSSFYGHGKDFDLLLSDAITNKIYDERALIQRGSSVLIQRIPGWPQRPIVVPNSKEKKGNDAPPLTCSGEAAAEVEKFDFTNLEPDILHEHKEVVVSINSPEMEMEAMNELDEDAKIKLLVNTPALRGYQCGGFTSAKVIGGSSWRNKGCRVLEPKIQPLGYVCYRCNEPGHFIQHCPTNGDRDYDIKLKPVTGIPKSMLQASSNGLYKLPSGSTAIFKPNEDAFDKEMEGISSTKQLTDLPPELFCPLCKKIMRDAVLGRKCCFNSFCDKCIREHIISKSMCYCGVKGVLADDLIPNRTLREIINAMLFEKSIGSSSGNGRSSITTGASNVKSSHLSSSAGRLAAFDNQEDATSSIVVSSIVKDDGKKKKDKNSDTSVSSLESSSRENLNEVLQPGSQKELMRKTKKSDTDGIHGVVTAGEKGNKKREKMVGHVDTGFRMCPSALDPGMLYPFPPATYNPYWYHGTTSMRWHEYGAYSGAGNPPGFSNATVGRTPLQPSNGVQGFFPQNEAKTRHEVNNSRRKSLPCNDDEESATAKKRRTSLPYKDDEESATAKKRRK